MAKSHVIDSLDALLEHYDREPAQASLDKVADRLTPAYRAWLEPVRFAVFATAGANGIDCSPRGDREPLFTIENDQLLLMPDWHGNNRLDTLRNLVAIPAVGIICLQPGVAECLRIGGAASISVDPILLSRFAKQNKQPRSVICVEINRVYFQCARSILRSGIWGDTAPDHAVPTAGEMLESAIGEFDGDNYDADLDDRQLKTLW